MALLGTHTTIAQPQGAKDVRSGVRARRGQATDPHSIAERVYIPLFPLFHHPKFKMNFSEPSSIVAASTRTNCRENEILARAHSKCQQSV